MFKALEDEINIRPHLCNSQQHQIVFLEHKESILTPPAFASLLKENERLCEIIRGGLAGKGYGGATFDDEANKERFNMWKDDYINTFGA